MKKSEIFAKLANEDRPLVLPAADIFTVAEFAEGSGLGRSTANTRLLLLEKEGKIRRVRMRHGGRINPAWQYLGK